ncbi:hypothetical protein ACX9MO_04855 [Pseudooceanicola sp. 502str34]
MFLELIATFVAGLAAAGVVLLVNRIVGGRLPKWMMPVAAGLVMIGMTVSNEYTWAPRTKATLPDTAEIVTEVETQVFYRPWTYVRPYVSRFAVVDHAATLRNPEQPALRITDVVFYQRWGAVQRLRVLVDCDGHRRAALEDGVTFGAGGAVEGAGWIDAGAEDPVTQAVCAEG